MSNLEYKPYRQLQAKDPSPLTGFSYFSYGLGFGPFLALMLAFVFRKDREKFEQLVQSCMVQALASILEACLGFSLLCAQLKDPLLDLSLEKLGVELLIWVFRIIFFVCSMMAFRRGMIAIPIFYMVTRKLIIWFQRKSLRKAFALNMLLPGLGQLYLGKIWLGWVLMASFLATFFVSGYLLLAFFRLALAKDLLTIMGFFFRLNDHVMGANLSSPIFVSIFAGILLLIYLISSIALFSFQRRPSFTQRTIIGSAGISYLMHLSILLAVLLIPIVLNEAPQKKQLNQRAQEILKELQKQEAQKKQKAPKLPPQKPAKTREMTFDLAIPKAIKGLNEFESKKYGTGSQKNSRPKTGYGERKEPLPPIEEALHGRDYKSYSEFISAKVREGKRDQEIWERASEKKYSIVVEYTIQSDGRISDIQIIDPSDNQQIDALTLAVIESMSPVLAPPRGKPIHITELFWNTPGDAYLDSELKSTLANYPDGRVIEEK